MVNSTSGFNEHTDISTESHNETVNADALVDTEAQKDKIDNLLDKIGSFDPATQKADDLKKISGVGPVILQNIHIF